MRIENFEDLKKAGKDCEYYLCFYQNYGVGGVAHDYRNMSKMEVLAWCNTPKEIRCAGFVTTSFTQASLWAND